MSISRAKGLITSVQTILNKTSQNKSQNTMLPNTKRPPLSLHHPIYVHPILKNNLQIRIYIAMSKRLQWTMYYNTFWRLKIPTYWRYKDDLQGFS